ncbi:MAG: ABC-2 transporter permease [Sphaerochaetaceae bacterium]|nr:ABC-2 transporter permease [Sphaerochaetaceae bacterium]
MKKRNVSECFCAYIPVCFFSFMFLLPGYPVLCGAFFVSLGLFQEFQSAREANDIVFSVLLPIAKKDVVKGKYLFVCMIEGCALLLMALSVVLRMTVFSKLAVYRNNELMNANLFALGMACVIFSLFNWIFLGGFFKTAYKFAKPFVLFVIAAFLVIFISEALHHVPSLEVVNAFGTESFTTQVLLFGSGIIIFLLMTVLSCKGACKSFEKIDL